ncbi:kelch-like protein 22 [Brienomyrus brachyistius]|uniref:kelch-like protein 22 n=1 Tax=Brienomyrus brachyistius TaxID=42636 RepID=UPI0020B36E27|nr:kelch-like protein 22 [Brienomyrus brachyistius]XP_048854507.1 kelch-like protein 22 [Brienomyrus brachyistius]XP_048854512.1 kelch-like protein 22 [Brienomyrus brachyistius]
MAEGAEAAQAGRCSRQVYRSQAHSQGVLTGLLSLRDAGALFDVTLLVDGQPIQAHRLLLAASCDYFRGMFAGGLREMHEPEVPVLGVSYAAMTKLLDFIYTAELQLDLDSVQEVLCAASLLQIQEVIGFCCDFLFSWLDDDNILEVYKLADMYNLEQLGARVHSYLLKNIQTFSRTSVYRQLPSEKVFGVLSSDDLEVDSENEVYEAALHYHYSPEQVETDQVCLQDPLPMLEAVRFCLMERPVLQRLHERLRNCVLRERVAAALRYHAQELWQPVLQGALTQPRSRSHCVLGFGGMYSPDSVAHGDELQVFHPSWGEWRTLAAPQAPRMSNQGIAVLNNFVYLIGGDKNTSSFRAETRCWRYDPRHNSWCIIKPLQQQHADHCVCVEGGYIYAIGGRDYSTELDCVERYSPSTNTWEYVAGLRREVYAHAGAVVDGKIYITCGRRRLSYLKETYCYDPQANNWTSRAEGPVERAWHGMAAVGGRAYVIGGSNDERGYRRDVLKVACYNANADSWSLVSPLPAGHGEPGIAVLDGCIYVLGGRSHDKGSRMKHVHLYEPSTDHWESGTAFEERVSGLAACELLVPRSTLAQARGWGQRAKASWEDPDFDNSDDSSDD